jgi:hypothetical protein
MMRTKCGSFKISFFDRATRTAASTAKSAAVASAACAAACREDVTRFAEKRLPQRFGICWD